MRCGLGKSADGLVERVIAAVATNGVEDKLKLAWVLKLEKKARSCRAVAHQCQAAPVRNHFGAAHLEEPRQGTALVASRSRKLFLGTAGYRLGTAWVPLGTAWVPPGYRLGTAWVPLCLFGALSQRTWLADYA